MQVKPGEHRRAITPSCIWQIGSLMMRLQVDRQAQQGR